MTYTPTSALSKFIAQCQGDSVHYSSPHIHPSSHLADKTPEERAHLLETTPLFTNIHAESAESGQSPPDPDTPFHFTCFVAAPEVEFREIASGEKPGPNAEDIAKSTGTGMRLVELDSMRAGPVDHGECTDLLVVRGSSGRFVGIGCLSLRFVECCGVGQDPVFGSKRKRLLQLDGSCPSSEVTQM